MIRSTLAALAVTAALLAPASVAFAADSTTPATQSAPTTVNPMKCVGAAEHRQAMDLRTQAINADLAALQKRRAVAVSSGNTAQVARIDARIAKLNARLAEIAANKAKLNQRCPA